MKKETLQKLLIITVSVFVIFQFFTSGDKVDASLKGNVDLIKNILFGLVILVSLIYAKLESKELLKKLVIAYLVLIPLYALFKFRGVI
ncbi:hypothetical protein [Peptoniphilus obesi]|uniref:hypothetical protein n=1 Tax=Peptoniphilus obesi TaxID=1472765 RepID=UPI0004B82F67|nr:hypothetical protein [Peptoniphilus obesi]